MRFTRFILPAALLVLAFTAAGYELGDTVDDFTLPHLTGEDVSLHDHLGEMEQRFRKRWDKFTKSFCSWFLR